ncbi:hypothetical protein F4V88_00280 [Neorhizobium galegae]|nr:hypothetical protein F4V88_00280 [Neorhizobium galegae]
MAASCRPFCATSLPDLASSPPGLARGSFPLCSCFFSLIPVLVTGIQPAQVFGLKRVFRPDRHRVTGFL